MDFFPIFQNTFHEVAMHPRCVVKMSLFRGLQRIVKECVWVCQNRMLRMEKKTSVIFFLFSLIFLVFSFGFLH